MSDWLKAWAEVRLIDEYRTAINALLITTGVSSVSMWLVAIGVFNAVAAAIVFSLLNLAIIVTVIYTDKKSKGVEVKING